MRKTTRLVTYAAIGLLVLGAAGYLAGGRDGGGEGALEDAPFAPDEVTASIDKALGRPSTALVAPAPALSQGTGRGADTAASSAVSAVEAPRALPAVKQGEAVAGGGSGGAPDGLASTSDRKIVQTASMRLQVKEVGASFEEVGRIATAAGGFVASSNFSFQGEHQVASVTVRVPATRFQDVLSQVRGLGVKVETETSNASDVTEEYTDLAARLRTLEATEAQLLQFLGQARNVSEVLQVQDRLNAVRTQIEQVKGRMALLDKLSDLATLAVHLRPVVAVAKADTGGVDLGAAVSEAWESSLEFLGGIAAGVLTVVVFSWWVPLLALPAWLVVWRWLRGRPSPQATRGFD